MKKEVILFDINETVLNLESLKPKFSDAFGSEDALSLWFSKLLHSSTVCITTNVNSNFSELANAMLDSVAAHYNCRLTDEKRNELLDSFSNLPPHSDIKEALDKLRASGFKTVAFSNSSLNLISAQMNNSGLINFFDTIISVEDSGSFKPNPDVYKFAGKVLGESVENLRLVATHDWDTHGALSAGLKAAYIDRTGSQYHPLYLKPEINSKTMGGVVEKL
ncbi:haloacid dehalogenase type II [Vibrio tapetis subsp. quintayensis]|uniref:haloacid dehalogenase type II n=1 Tax=Vibrio tapetis TaxID=52443 RepID=UPI0025B35365|nr:haloacid dehalogenase type II [Vibrio tapetis]MDN3682037.1 haloacid dehalogenase type II [Vibrio tapetis subsp. quintayensis]